MKIKLIKSTNEIDNDFVGLKVKGNDISFYYPEFYLFDETEIDTKEIKKYRNNILSILISIIYSKKNNDEFNEIYIESVNITDDSLKSYIWIIKDYLNNGFYKSFDKVNKVNLNGKINWKKTLNSNPIITKSNKVVYDKIIVNSNISIDSILVDIHKYVLKKSLDVLGWLFDLDSSFIHIKDINNELNNKYINILSKELLNTFNDSKKIRLNNFLTVLKGLDSSPLNHDYVYGTNTYYYVFEKMIDSIFSNISSIKEFYPSGSYVLKPSNVEIKSSNLRPDTIFFKDKNIYIIDSKYYRYDITKNTSDLPSTSSIIKQLGYASFIKENKEEYKDYNIYNVFLLPSCNKKVSSNSNDILKCIGYSKSNIISESKINEETYYKIHTILIDLKYVVNAFNKSINIKSNLRDELINLIKVS